MHLHEDIEHPAALLLLLLLLLVLVLLLLLGAMAQFSLPLQALILEMLIAMAGITYTTQDSRPPAASEG